MKIYFSGSIRGGDQDADLYQELISDLKQYGSVLTEHIGWKNTDTQMSDREIHDRDLNWVKECDLVIAEVTVPSLGVGYEIGRALEINKPVICLYRCINGKATSAMIRGCEEISCYEYTNLEGAKEILKQKLNSI
jgi:nucleoside 2-deoxyribosyltransferase